MTEDNIKALNSGQMNNTTSEFSLNHDAEALRVTISSSNSDFFSSQW